jgi:hypothetical protein
MCITRNQRALLWYKNSNQEDFMRTPTVLFSVLLAILAFTSFMSGGRENKIKVVQSFLEERKAGNREKALSYMAKDARIWFEKKEGSGEPWRLEGPWQEWDKFFKATRTYQDWAEDSESVSVTSTEVNDFYRLIEREPWPNRLTWYFDQEGKITGFFLKPLQEGRPRSRLEEFKEWARTHHPEELIYLIPEGEISPTGDRPQRWKKILSEWRRMVGLPPIE